MDPMAGNTGFVQPACGAPVAPVKGPLCGPSSAPCRRIAEHMADQLNAEQEVSLAFAGGAVHVLQERSIPTYVALATDGSRSGSQQIQGPTMKVGGPPMVSLALDDEGVAVALLHGGAAGTTELWRRGAGVSDWALDSALQADIVDRQRFLAGAGCLHAGLLLSYDVSPDRQNHPVYAVYDGRWQEFVLGPRNIESAGAPALAVDAAGTVHLAYWRATARAYALYYAIPGRTLETVGATGSATPSHVQHRPGNPLLALTTDPDGEPVVHVARAFMEPSGNTEAIALATRRAGAWSEREVMRWAPRSVPTCPMVEGQSCTYTVEDVQLRGLFASESGDLRIFVQRHVHAETSTYACMTLPIDCVDPPPCGPNPRMCFFTSGLPTDAMDEVLIGWPEGDRFEFAPYDGPVPQAVSPEGHFWAQRRPALGEYLTLLEHGP